jgi:steroid delta-isomerase-like uncharacterized protein
MSVDENKALVRQVVEKFWNTGNPAALDNLFAANYVNHDPYNPTVTDLQGFKQWAGVIYNALPDEHVTIDDLFAEGDKVMERFTARGTHKGDFGGIPPTGKEVVNTGIIVYRIAGGKVAESWWSYNMLGILQQLGVIPPVQGGS